MWRDSCRVFQVERIRRTCWIGTFQMSPRRSDVLIISDLRKVFTPDATMLNFYCEEINSKGQKIGVAKCLLKLISLWDGSNPKYPIWVLEEYSVRFQRTQISPLSAFRVYANTNFDWNYQAFNAIIWEIRRFAGRLPIKISRKKSFQLLFMQIVEHPARSNRFLWLFVSATVLFT